jgi:hypothetical protein
MSNIALLSRQALFISLQKQEPKQVKKIPPVYEVVTNTVWRAGRHGPHHHHVLTCKRAKGSLIGSQATLPVPACLG